MLWHFVTPLVLIAIYYVVFTGIRTNPVHDFWVYLCVGIFPFTFLNTNLTSGCTCITNNASLVNKMYFPREILVLAQVVSSFIVMLSAYAVTLVLILVSGYPLEPVSVLMVPLAFLLSFVFATGVVMLFSSVSVYCRDVQHLLSSLGIAFFFATPNYFLLSETSGLLNQLIWINPFTYYVEMFHDLLYFGRVPETGMLYMTVLITAITFVFGTAVFRRLKDGFAERL